MIVKLKQKRISKSNSKKIKFEEYKNCLYGEKYQKEGDIYFLRSVNHETYLQKKKVYTKPI